MLSGYTSIEDKGVGKKEDDRGGGHQKWLATAAATVFCISATAIFLIASDAPSLFSSSSSLSSSSSPLVSSDETTTLSFGTYRKNYEPLPYFTQDATNVLTYKILSGYDGIFEPYVYNVIELEGMSDNAEYTYKYTVKNLNDEDEDNVISGSFDGEVAEIEVKCDPFDEYEISIDEYDVNGEFRSSLSGSVLCMYVRREMRELTDDDLSSTMDAFYTLWSGISQEEGQDLYGEEFYSSAYLTAMHFFGASQMDADSFHLGVGFLSHHMQMTTIFEKSIQAVDPSVTCPYWDFTIDSITYSEENFDLFPFQESTFGTLVYGPSEDYSGWNYATSKVDDGRIRDGRWANIMVDVNTLYPELLNGYGYYRAPWIMNPSPYIVRYPSTPDISKITVPSCKDCK